MKNTQENQNNIYDSYIETMSHAAVQIVGAAHNVSALDEARWDALQHLMMDKDGVSSLYFYYGKTPVQVAARRYAKVARLIRTVDPEAMSEEDLEAFKREGLKLIEIDGFDWECIENADDAAKHMVLAGLEEIVSLTQKLVKLVPEGVDLEAFAKLLPEIADKDISEDIDYFISAAVEALS